MASETAVLATLDRLYDAAVDPAGWPDAVSALRDLFGAAGACVFTMDAGTREVPFWVGLGMEAGARAYREHYATVDPRLRFALANPQTRVHYDYLFIDEWGMDHDEFYEFQRKSSDDFRYFLGCPAWIEVAMAGFTAIHWPRRRGHARPEDIRLLQSLSPHVQRALQVGHRLAGLSLRLTASETAFEHLRQGFLLLDARGRVLLMNRLAARMLAAKDGLALDSGELHARRPSVDAALQALIGGVHATGSPTGPPAGGVMAVPRFSDRRSYGVLVAPLPDGALPLGVERPSVLVFVSDPEQSHEIPEESLMRLWGLTRTEAALAGRLATGSSVEHAAGALGIAKTTARLHLQHIFKKTGTHRQADLVRLLIASPTPRPVIDR